MTKPKEIDAKVCQEVRLWRAQGYTIEQLARIYELTRDEVLAVLRAGPEPAPRGMPL